MRLERGRGQVEEEGWHIFSGSKEQDSNSEGSDTGTEAELAPRSPQKPSPGQAPRDTPDCLAAPNLLLSLHFQGF